MESTFASTFHERRLARMMDRAVEITPRWSSLAVPAAIVLFVASRLFLLYGFTPRSSDLSLYATYALQDSLAREGGQTLYQFRAEVYERSAAEAARGLREPTVEGSDVIEYPPLALGVVLLPDALTVLARDPTFYESYAAGFRLLMASLDGVAFVLVWWVASRLFSQEGPWRRALRLTVYTVSGFLLGHVLYDRLDIVVTLAMLATMALLLMARRTGWFLAALAVAVHMKVVPILLAPLFIVASLDASLVERTSRAKATLALVGQAAVRLSGLALGLALLYAPFRAAWGPRCLDFLRYHAQRGIEVESSFASVLFVLASFGLPTRLVVQYGATDVLSPLSNLFSRLSPVLVATAVGSLTLAFARRALSRGGAPDEVAAADPRAGVLACRDPGAVVAYTLATLLGALMTSKVLSAQYLIWLAPFVALCPLEGRARHVVFIVYVAICLLTALIFPYFYFGHIAGMVPASVAGGVPSNYRGPTLLGKLLLFGRNGLLLALSVVVVASLCRGARPFVRPDGLD